MSQKPTSKPIVRQRKPLSEGQRFGRLVLVRLAEPERIIKGKRYYWLCACDCGNEVIVRADKLKSGNTTSCKCVQHSTGAGKGKHNGWRSPEYVTWLKMKGRCCNESSDKYAEYGGRGIKVCDRWLDSFPAFLEDMGKKPTPAHTIERIDNDKGYSPENCRWATRKEQQRNRRTCHYLTHDGKTLSIAEWAEVTGIVANTIANRIFNGWSTEQALTIPPIPREARRNHKRC